MAIHYTPPQEAPKLKPGTYPVTIVSAIEKTSKAGNPMVEIQVQPDGYTLKIKCFLVFSESASWRAAEIRRAFGFDDPIEEPVSFEASEMIGATALATLDFEESGKYLEVSEWHKPAPAQRKPVTPQRQAAPARPKRPLDPDLDGDDVPF